MVSPFCGERQWRAMPALPHLQDKIRGQKTRFMLPDDVGDQGLCSVSVSLAATRVLEGKYPQGVMNRQGPLRGILPPRKGEGVRPPLALAVDVHPADLGHQWSTRRAMVSGSREKMLTCWPYSEAMMLLNGRFQVIKGNHRDHRAELFFMVNPHPLVHRVEDGRIKKAVVAARRPDSFTTWAPLAVASATSSVK